MPKWNPVNVCSYDLQEAGDHRRRIVRTGGTAIAILDSLRGQAPPERMGEVVGRISFFVNAGCSVVEEMCKMRAFAGSRTPSPGTGTASATRLSGASATACRSTRSGLTEAQPEQRSSGSCWRCWPSPCPGTPGPAPSSCPPGTRRWACPARWTSSGACASSRCWPTSRTCLSTATCSTARRWWRPRRPSWWPARRRSWPRSRSWAGWSRRWSRGSSRPGSSPRTLRPGAHRVRSGPGGGRQLLPGHRAQPAHH